MQAERKIVVGPYPLRRIDNARLQCREYLASGYRNWYPSSALQYLATKTRNAHLQALEVLKGIDLLVEPSRHLRAGVASRQRHQIKRRVKFPPKLHATTVA